ncbi:MAG: carbamoyl-phosphate synthase large subunit [Acetobacteraceae bacterium]|nr:carbamoyl-phosphate synthase large subunit [Acetobacteraceae bacterium]
MTFQRLLIANRGEIAIRIARAAAELGIASVAVHSRDDADSLHLRHADAVHALAGAGPAAYIDVAAILFAAQAAGCDAVHPGYGFLSENAAFARACADAGLSFIGPAPDILDLFGDKTAARRLADECGVPVAAGTAVATLAEAQDFMARQGAVMVKAAAGGGGRGMRMATTSAELASAWDRCAAEAQTAFGCSNLYLEALLGEARHIEVQVAGDGSGRVAHLGERECTIQRRHQKILEVAPSPSLAPAVRERIIQAALTLAERVRYRTLGTFEFLLDAADGERFVFIEANPRLQVEHTVTEAVFGVDLVQAQLHLAAGASLEEAGIPSRPEARGCAIQLRVNMESMQPDGSVAPAGGGTITAYDPPAGPGVRVDGFGYAGYRTSPSFDSLLAKVIVHVTSGGWTAALARARRTLREFRIEGVPTNLAFLGALIEHPDVAADRLTTRFLDAATPALLDAAGRWRSAGTFVAGPAAPSASPAAAPPSGPAGTRPVTAPMQGLVVEIEVAEGDTVRAGQTVAVLEAMKMQHLVPASVSGVVRRVATGRGEVLASGQPVLFIEPAAVDEACTPAEDVWDPEAIRPDLAEMLARKARLLDAARPDAVAKRHRQGGRTARENVEDLMDPGSFVEYGGLAVAGQRARRPMEELVRISPADGVICGFGTVNADLFGEERAGTVAAAYDCTVLAGTQGNNGHKKQDRIYRLAAELRRPLVLLAEGGGGRPGETDREHSSAARLDIPTFHAFAKLSGLVPLVGVVHGRCFAGNAALLGCCDVIIADGSACIGMGGPAMIEGGGLGVYRPEEVGPAGVQVPNGVIDILVENERAAIATAKRYLSYFQGAMAGWSCPDQRELRRSIPENRLRVYDVRGVIRTLADTGSVLELRPAFGIGIVTALIRIEGRPMGLIANNPAHLGGAIDGDAGDKAARFLGLCDAHDLPVLSLIDTPGFMVGPEAERTAQVRRVCRMFTTGANITVPFFAVVLRKGYGLGAQAMAAGSFHAPLFTVAWPTGEFGGMGLEGAVRLGYRSELAPIADPAEREALYRHHLDNLYARGRATNVASVLEIDDVIDPAETQRWILRGLAMVGTARPREGKKRPNVETW